jgi:hypothetical protein
MTRDAIIAEAARRLGDTSTAFVAELSAAFDLVLGDLAAAQAIDDLRDSNSTALTILDQRNYSALTLTGLVAPNYPYEILALKVWAWESEAAIVRVNDTDYEQMRMRDGESYRGRPVVWRPFPDMRTIQVHPPVGADDAGAAIEVLFVRPPTTISGATDLTEVRGEDIDTIIYGLICRNARLADETEVDEQESWQLYLAGRSRMWARRHNNRVGTIAMDD